MKRHNLNNQAGSALILALTILLVLTILGVTAMRTTSLEDKMAGNARDAQKAFEAAEYALRQAELAIVNRTITQNQFNNAGALFRDRVPGDDEAWTSEANWGAATNAVLYPDWTDPIPKVSRAPQFIIQRVDAKFPIAESPELTDYSEGDRELAVFQISARGYGVSPHSRVMLQSYFLLCCREEN